MDFSENQVTSSISEGLDDSVKTSTRTLTTLISNAKSFYESNKTFVIIAAGAAILFAINNKKMIKLPTK